MSKIIKSCFFIFLTALVIAATSLYVYKFGFGLWDDHEDWAFLGAFFGGIFGPIFTLASVYLLVLTLNETKKSNAEQVDLIKKQHFEESFLNIINSIKLSLESKNLVNPENQNSKDNDFFTNATLWVVTKFKIGKDTDIYEDAWNTASSFISNHQGQFDTEMFLLQPLLLKLRNLSDDDREYYYTLIKGMITNDQRFWLEVYAEVWSLEIRYILRDFQRFSELPKKVKEHIDSLTEY
ncbi:hypothetical protein [Moritella sp. 28]|uniref:hypothetical protein n=1 Tax=Moritella sp. 28 TaxID=2746232 RepID=UPI001BAAA0CD|nr:hypothetical protein [Moritella sp. 28]QUM84594.1 hypothetical protein HWV02_08800 [Moritella sp. 28]